MRLVRRRHLAIRAAVWITVMVAGAALPAAGSPATNLGSLADSSRLETQLGDAITNPVCSTLSMMGVSRSSSDDSSASDMEDLFGRCQDLVQTADQIQMGGTPTFSLGMNAEDTNDALDQISQMQLPGIGAGATEIAIMHVGIVGQRLHALRQGDTSGLMLAGNLLDSEGNRIPLAYELFGEDSAAGADGGWTDGLGVYLNFLGGFGDRDSNDEELGFDFRDLGGTLGADYFFTDMLVGGLAFSYTNSDRDFHRNRGEIESDTYAGSIYASFAPNDFYLDAIVSIAHNDIDTKRKIRYGQGSANPVNRTAKGNTDANEFSFGGVTGYQFHIGEMTLGPVARGEYTWLDIDSFRETGAQGLNLSHGHDRVSSATMGLGGEVRYAISTGFGVVVPQLNLEWEHQFANDSREITSRYTADPTNTGFFVKTKKPDRDYANLSASVSATFKGGLSAFLDYSTLIFHKRLDEHMFTLGGRWEF